MQLICEAIAMVAWGGSPRVVLAGLRFGEVLLYPARLLAHDAGVELSALRRLDVAGSDILVERLVV